MTTLVIGIILIVAGVAFAAAPLLRRVSRPDESGDGHAAGVVPPAQSGGRATSAETARTASHLAPAPGTAPWALELEELALDKAMGKLSDSDYERLRAELVQRASAHAPRAVDAAAAADAAAAVEANTEDARVLDRGAGRVPGRLAALEAEAEQLIRAARAATAPSCRSCGTRPESGARFCSRCGVALGGCPGCGAAVRADGARFCDQCGAALNA